MLAAFGVPLELRSVRAGRVLARAGEPIDTIFVPHTAIVSVARQTALDPVPLTVALIGYEGVVGWPALMGVPTWPHQALVVSSGEIGCILRDDLMAACRAHSALSATLFRVMHNHTLQLAQSVVANLGHSAERRLARWLLMLDDRIHGDSIAITHVAIAQLLNVRRATVTDGLHVLEGEGLILSTRGKLQIRDRAGLERRAGQSYGLSEEDYNVSIESFGKSQRYAVGLMPTV